MVRRENAVWVDGQLTGNGLAPIPFAELAKKAHEMGLVTGVSVHGFNRWSWAEADFVIDGVRERLPLDAMAVKYGDGAPGVKKAMMNSAGFHLLDRQNPAYPATQLNNAMVTYYSPVATLVELKVNKGSGEVQVLDHHSWIECGRVLVPELVKGQLEGGIAMGIGHALLEKCRSTRAALRKGTGTSTATGCRGRRTWRFGTRRRRSSRRCRRPIRPKASPRW